MGWGADCSWEIKATPFINEHRVLWGICHYRPFTICMSPESLFPWDFQYKLPHTIKKKGFLDALHYQKPPSNLIAYLWLLYLNVYIYNICIFKIYILTCCMCNMTKKKSKKCNKMKERPKKYVISMITLSLPQVHCKLCKKIHTK